MMSAIELPWRIEAFREYLSYEVLQPAASVLATFEGEVISSKNPNILKMQKLLELRTSKYTWLPNRSGSKDINWNLEGDVTRNKGRLLTSMLILYPKEMCDDKIKLTEFGAALSKGLVSKKEFYDYLIKNFQYPHPAWKENWQEWKSSGKVLLPFVYLLEALLLLHQVSPEQAYLTSSEIASHLYKDASHDDIKSKVEDICQERMIKDKKNIARDEKISRKFTDLLGFLCLTRYCHYDGNDIALTTVAKHDEELVHFSVKRKGQNVVAELKVLISDAKKGLVK